MYDVFFLTLSGLVPIAEKEIHSIINITKNRIKRITDSIVLLNTSLQNACLLAYASQTAKSVLVKVGESDMEMKKINLQSLEPFIGKQKTFAVRSLSKNKTVEEKIGAELKKHTSLKVSLKTPELLFIAFQHEDKIQICIDTAGFELAKRTYRIYIHPETIKAPLAFAATTLAAYKSLLDPFCGSGMIPIEAALNKTNISPHFYSKQKFLFTKFPNIEQDSIFALRDSKIKKEIKEKIYASDKNPSFLRGAEKNAILAGVKQNISFSRLDIKDLDIKFTESSIDLIATQPPPLTKQNHPFIEKLYAEFFYQAEYIASNVSCITTEASLQALTKAASKYRFEIEQTFSVEQNKIVLFKKI
ncbi:hypothetical protein DRJ19_01225 [Candidatus Woesearchaeota archaeon]|nr:MAG: hypothetical protein DRJ19_01225 [Candidatus Woesearchaeota archaeon]